MKTPIIAFSLLLLASVADAQLLTETRAAATPAIAPSTPLQPRGVEPVVTLPRFEQPRTGAMATTGMLFAASGIVAGAYIGAGIACGGAEADSWCGLGGGLLGAMVGEVVMLPAGVHFASSNTSYGKKLLVSSAVMLGGMALAPFTAGVSLLAVPPMQLAMVMGMEHKAPGRAR